MPRNQISEQQAGKADPANTELYYLFQLGRPLQLANPVTRVPHRQRISTSFIEELQQWQMPLKKMLDQSFLQDVGDYAGMSRESLVLQQKTGYSAVYRAWQELKFYLSAITGQSQVSMKSAAQIYEVWCFLHIRQILLHDLGFTEKQAGKNSLVLNEYFE